jgi:hypothetical protein
MYFNQLNSLLFKQLLRKSLGYIVVISTILLGACGGGGGGGGSSANQVCDRLTLLTTDTILPGDPIEFKTNETLDAVYIVLSDSEVPLSSITSDMGYIVNAPITPDLAANGGEITLVAEMGGARCNIPAITVDALPPASDTDNYADVLDTLEQALIKFEEAFGYDPETVSDEDIQNDPYLLAAHYIHELFNDPASEISLAYQRNVFATMSANDKAYIAQVMEKLDLKTLLENFASRFDGPIFTTTPDSGEIANVAAAEPMVRRAQCTGSYADNTKHKVAINNGETLSRGMKLSYEAQTKQRNAQSAAASQAAKSSALNTLFTVGGQLGKGAAATPLAVLTTAMAISSITNNMEIDMVAALLPSEITEAKLTIIPKPRLEEDYTEKFSEPSWLFRVDARSKEYDFSKLVVDTGFAALGAPKSPVDPNLMFGASEVANRVTSKAGAQDCELIVPPISWNNIQIGSDYAEPKFISGTAFSLNTGQDRKITPQEVGQSELEVKLKSGKFPSYTNTLAMEQDTIVMENLAKSFLFSSSPIVVNTPGEVIDVNVSILNSVLPEKHEMQTSSNLSVSKTRSGDSLQLRIATPSDPEGYPQYITLTSTSKTLVPTEPRRTTAEVKLADLKISIEETLAGSCDETVYTEENRAIITGFSNDDSVTWTSNGGTLTELANNTVRFSTEDVGTFVLTATSNEDSNIKANVTINTLDCAGNVYMNANVVTNASSPREDCTNSNPEDVEIETIFGVVNPDYQGLSPANIRQIMGSLSEGRPFNFDQSDSDNLVFSEERGDQCLTTSVALIADSAGTIENMGDNTIGFGTSSETQGRCIEVEYSEGEKGTDCITSGALGSYIMAWVFDHEAEADYELKIDLACSAKPVEGLQSGNNIIFVIHTYDENGQEVNVLPLTNPPGGGTTCLDGVLPSGKRWTIPAMASGSQVMIYASFFDSVLASPPATQQDPGEQVLKNSGDVSGTIQVIVE